MTLTPTQARCLRMMQKAGSLLADEHFCSFSGLEGPLGVSRRVADSLIALGLARIADRSTYHSIIEPTEAGRAEARRLEEEKTT